MGFAQSVRNNMVNKWLYLIGGILFIMALGYILNISLLRNSVGNNGGNKLKVNASIYPLYFFSSQIGGDKAEVKNITPAGAEPHDYDPSTQDIAQIEDGNMLVLNGGVEAWGNKIKDNLKGTGVKIVVAGDGLLKKELAQGGEKMQDPHVWLSPKLAKKEVAKITQGYMEIDPNNSDFYQVNKRNLDIELDKLDSEYKAGLVNCKNKDIITSHAAFAYFAESYGLRQVPISGLSPDEEPSAQQLAEVAKFAKQNNVKYIFFESLVSPKLSETIANEAGVKTMVLDPIEGISDDNIKQGKNYFTVMKDNLKNLQKALQCNK